MKSTKQKILDYIQKKGEVTPKEISDFFSLGSVMVHRHLKKLQKENKIARKGQIPKVFYFYIKTDKESRVRESLNFVKENFLDKFKEEKSNFWNIKKQKNVDFSFLLKKSAFFSSKIEGNSLDLNSFMNVFEIKKEKKKEAEEIYDLVKGYEFAKNHILTESFFLKVHKIISKQLVSKKRQGVYRKEPVGVFSGSGLEYVAIEPDLIKTEISIFFSEIGKLLSQKMTKQEVCFYSIWIHLHFVLIHPFSDGNGRMARLLEKWFLAEKLDKKYWYLESEKYYWDNLNIYYKSLKLGQNYWVVDFKKAKKFFER
ncbi:MAG: Fic family protein [Candidatus Pacebacteria bacterium]|nr:Fic family protein [Candidatus Paceibacterota bacterium]